MNTQPLHILIAEDDKNLSFLLKSNIEEDGYKASCCDNGMEAWNVFLTHHFDLCIIDIMMPVQDGFTLAEMIRKQNPHIPIIFLTARKLKEDVYRGFEIGADDYVTKPFSARELLFRMKAILKRGKQEIASSPNNQIFTLGKLSFNYTGRKLTTPSGTKTLSTKENELLRLFCESKNIVLNRNRLLVEVWGNDDYFVSKSLDVYITKLRKLLKDDPNISIQNYHSVGYKMIEMTPA